MEKLHSKSSVSPASGYSFPTIDTDNPSLFNEGVPNKPGVKDGFESASKDKALSGELGEEKGKRKSQKLPLGYDREVEDQFLPKTGVQYRFLKYRPIFKGNYNEKESVAPLVSPEIIEI